MHYWLLGLLALLLLHKKKAGPGFGGLKPVLQDVHGVDANGLPQGNCFPACIASIMGLGLHQVPFFSTESQRAQLQDANRWLRQFGLKLIIKPFTTAKPKNGEYCLARGESPRFPGFFHMVVWCNNKIAHDPHPDQRGIVGKPTHLIMFKKA